jgi:putative ABC transport system permease protein
MTAHVLRLIWNRRRQNVLLTLEILLSFLVLFGVIVVAVQYISHWRTPLGFDFERVWSVEVRRQAGTPAADANAAVLYRQLFAAIEALPDVESAAGAFILPYSGSSARGTLPLADGRAIGHQYSSGTDDLDDVLDLRLLQGRWFSREDDAARFTPVVVNQHFARELFGDRNPLNQRIALAAIPETAHLPANLRVVGILDDFRKDGELAAPESFAFYRARLDTQTGDNVQPGSEGLPSVIALRLAPGTTATFEETLVRTLEAVAPDWTFRVQAMADMRDHTLRGYLVPLALAAIVTFFLLAMVALGLTGVVWQSITRRTSEFGLRRANGATARHVRRQILAELVVLTSLALIVGIAIVAQLPLLPAIVWGLQLPPAPVWGPSIAVSAGVIYLLTLSCGLYPSWLAAGIQPADALRYE